MLSLMCVAQLANDWTLSVSDWVSNSACPLGVWRCLSPSYLSIQLRSWLHPRARNRRPILDRKTSSRRFICLRACHMAFSNACIMILSANLCLAHGVGVRKAMPSSTRVRCRDFNLEPGLANHHVSTTRQHVRQRTLSSTDHWKGRVARHVLHVLPLTAIMQDVQ